jgi:hypothetical protein
VAAAVAPLYRGDTVTVGRGARTLPSWGTALGLLTLWVPAVVSHDGGNLTPPGKSDDRWRHPYRRAPRRQELLPPWGLATDV